MRADNTRHLTAAAARRRAECLARVHAVLEDLQRTGGPVTVTAVAAAAGVSRTFLYDPAQQHLLTQLRSITADQPSTPHRPAVPVPQRISAASHQQVVCALRERNERLNHDNRQLRTELALTLGQLRELKRRRNT